jgi:hypothetical protein
VISEVVEHGISNFLHSGTPYALAWRVLGGIPCAAVQDRFSGLHRPAFRLLAFNRLAYRRQQLAARERLRQDVARPKLARHVRSHGLTGVPSGVLGGCGFNRDRSRRAWNAKLKNTAAGWIGRHPQATAVAFDD